MSRRFGGEPQGHKCSGPELPTGFLLHGANQEPGFLSRSADCMLPPPLCSAWPRVCVEEHTGLRPIASARRTGLCYWSHLIYDLRGKCGAAQRVQRRPGGQSTASLGWQLSPGRGAQPAGSVGSGQNRLLHSRHSLKCRPVFATAFFMRLR